MLFEDVVGVNAVLIVFHFNAGTISQGGRFIQGFGMFASPLATIFWSFGSQILLDFGHPKKHLFFCGSTEIVVASVGIVANVERVRGGTPRGFHLLRTHFTGGCGAKIKRVDCFLIFVLNGHVSK